MSDEDDRVLARSSPPIAVRLKPQRPTDVPFSGPELQGSTPLGLPFPLPTDLLADAAAHVKALSDAVAALLALPGRAWGAMYTGTNATGDVALTTTGLSSISHYFVGNGHRSSDMANRGLVYLYLLGGSMGAPGNAWVCCWGSDGAAQIPNSPYHYSWHGKGAPGLRS